MFLFQIDALSGVVQAVAGRCEVYLDGGVRCGTDIMKALAMGARCVFVGRPAIYALAHNVRLSKNSVDIANNCSPNSQIVLTFRKLFDLAFPP